MGPHGEQTMVAAPNPRLGIDPQSLDDDDLLRELASLHDTRHDTLRHGSVAALEHHNRRMAELEAEYLRRFPQREVSPSRLADSTGSMLR